MTKITTVEEMEATQNRVQSYLGYTAPHQDFAAIMDHGNFEIRVGEELYQPTEADRNIEHLTQSLRRLKA